MECNLRKRGIACRVLADTSKVLQVECIQPDRVRAARQMVHDQRVTVGVVRFRGNASQIVQAAGYECAVT